MLAKSHTGDATNFKTAVDLIQAQYGAARDVTVRMLELGDDEVLLDAEGEVKPRTMAGTVLVYKILGGASFKGEDLDDIYELGEYIMKSIGTVGISMVSIGPPPRAPSNSSAGKGNKADKEGNAAEGSTPPAGVIECNQLIRRLLDNLKKHKTIQAGLATEGSEWVAMINNLGCITKLEMALVVNEFMR